MTSLLKLLKLLDTNHYSFAARSALTGDGPCRASGGRVVPETLPHISFLIGASKEKAGIGERNAPWIRPFEKRDAVKVPEIVAETKLHNPFTGGGPEIPKDHSQCWVRHVFASSSASERRNPMDITRATRSGTPCMSSLAG